MIMDVLKGLLFINGIDVYDRFGAFLAEKAEGGTANYDSLMRIPNLKEVPEVSVREYARPQSSRQRSRRGM